MDDSTKMLHVVSVVLIIVNTILVYFTEFSYLHEADPELGETTGIFATLKKYFYAGSSPRVGESATTGGWLTHIGKIFMSIVIVIVLALNQQTFNSTWIFVIALFAYIVMSYANLQRSHNLLLNTDSHKKSCGYVMPMNLYYSDKFYELRIGYGFLIMVTALMICYRDIKGNCSETASKILAIFSPMIMLVLLLLISMVTSQPFTENDRTGSAFDYVFSFFKGVKTGQTVDDYKKFLGFDWGFHDPTAPGISAADAAAVDAGSSPDPATDEKSGDQLSKVQNRVYMKFILIAALFSFFVYSAVTSEVQCGLDLKSPQKIISKTPTYMIAFIVLSPFIIKNIMINECTVDYSEATYKQDEVSANSGTTNFTGQSSFDISCLIDKMGGLEIYILLCLLCILMYAGKSTGFKLNIVLLCIVASVAFGFIIKPAAGESAAPAEACDTATWSDANCTAAAKVPARCTGNADDGTTSCVALASDGDCSGAPGCAWSVEVNYSGAKDGGAGTTAAQCCT
jgi:hypothetical protein